MTYSPGLRPEDLRKLADTLERREKSRTLPGIGAPVQIEFYGKDGAHLTGYGDNPALLTAVKKQIRLEWNDLRTRALARLDDEVAQLQEAIAAGLGLSSEGAAASGIEAPSGWQDAPAA